MSNLYNTTSKEYQNEYEVLVYYNNVSNGQSNNVLSRISAYDSQNRNYMVPVTAIRKLPTTLQWTNISLSNTN